MGHSINLKYWLLTGLTLLTFTLPAKAQNEVQNLVDSIQSVQQVKQDIKETIQKN